MIILRRLAAGSTEKVTFEQDLQGEGCVEEKVPGRGKGQCKYSKESGGR